jgi:2-polyprenyl-6-methoxyphenol hydroxylase-like FAD-dependent oxidoreductase
LCSKLLHKPSRLQEPIGLVGACAAASRRTGGRAKIAGMASASGSNAPSLLISGGGIAGLTLGILLKERGWSPLVVEREPAPSAGGYMMDFFGTGWDVAERMGLTEALRAIRSPIDSVRCVDGRGRPFLDVPIDRVREALDGRYVYLLRSDLERILLERAGRAGVEIRFGASIRSLVDVGDGLEATFEDGEAVRVDLVVGADGVHSRVRELAFGPEASFARRFGCRVAAFHAPLAPEVGRSVVLYEEPDRIAFFYPLSDDRMDAMYVFRDDSPDAAARDDRLSLLRRRYEGAGWIASRVVEGLPDRTPLFFDVLEQIVMPRWSSGRVCLIGDACGCLTLAAGQGSHMAMAGAYVLASELLRSPGDHEAAFRAYESFLRPHVERKQAEAARMAARFVPSPDSWMWLRRLVIRALFTRPILRLAMRRMGGRSVLKAYDR